MIEVTNYGEASGFGTYPINMGCVTNLDEADVVLGVVISPSYDRVEFSPRRWLFDNVEVAPIFYAEHRPLDSSSIMVFGFSGHPRRKNVMVRYRVEAFSSPLSVIVYSLKGALPQMRKVGDSGGRQIGAGSANGETQYEAGVVLSWGATWFYPQDYGSDPLLVSGTPAAEFVHALFEPRDYIHSCAIQRTTPGPLSVTHSGGVGAFTALSVEIAERPPEPLPPPGPSPDPGPPTALLTAYRPAKLALVSADLDLTRGLRVVLLGASYTPNLDAERWGEIAAHEVVGPGYAANGKPANGIPYAMGANALVIGQEDISWAGAMFDVKYAVLIATAPGEPVSEARLIGYADLNPDGPALTLRTGTLTLSWADSIIATLT